MLSLEEPDLYTPVFFDKTVEIDPDTDEKEYWYKPKGNLYWDLREKDDWSCVPKIYD